MYNYLLSKLRDMSSEDKETAKKAAARLRLTVSGSAACPVPIMNQWEEISGRHDLLRLHIQMREAQETQGKRLSVNLQPVHLQCMHFAQKRPL